MIAAITVAKAVLQRLWWSTPFLLLTILLLWWGLAGKQSKIDALNAWGGEVLVATQDAAANPRLNKRDVPAQIRELGSGIARLRAGLNKAKASALAAAKNDAERQAEFTRQAAGLVAEDRARQSVIDRLVVAAAEPQEPGDCKLPTALKEVWK